MPVNASLLQPSEYLAGNVNEWKEYTFRISEPGGGYLASAPLNFMEYDLWQRTDGLAVGTAGKPRSITVRPKDNAILVSPSADKAYELYYDYVREPQILLLDTDIPIITVSLHMLIVYEALTRYGAFEAAPEIVLSARNNAHVLRGAMERLYLPALTIGPHG